jgi:hypothetical protein
MPPEPTVLRSSNCRNCMGIINLCPHALHGVVASGGRSPGMNTLAPQLAQVTMRRGFIALSFFAAADADFPSFRGSQPLLLYNSISRPGDKLDVQNAPAPGPNAALYLFDQIAGLCKYLACAN